eukprot:365906-Chlamydomonas_euryale.AAC.3
MSCEGRSKISLQFVALTFCSSPMCAAPQTITEVSQYLNLANRLTFNNISVTRPDGRVECPATHCSCPYGWHVNRQPATA